jgi:hypothetical protein
MFSSLRAFQRYKVCKFSSPFDPFPDFYLILWKIFEPAERNSQQKRRRRVFSLMGPLVSGRNERGRLWGSDGLGAREPGPHVMFNETQ